MKEKVRITDVSPRDGLQNEAGVIPTSEKAELVRRLARSGVDEVEVSSFVSAKWVPQLGDAAELFGLLSAGDGRGPLLSALVPNERGLDSALEVNARAGRALIGKVSVFTAASETFSKKNTNATIAETIERFRPVVTRAHGAGLAVRGYVSCVVACPFEGAIGPGAVVDVCRRLLELGVDELDLGDTIGAGRAGTMRALLEACAAAFPLSGGKAPVTVHLHDTFGHAAECVRVALELGCRSFDGSAAGLGGCPYAGTAEKRAPGNISTELLVATVEAAGFRTGVDRAALGEAAAFASSIVAKARAGAGS
jgi:hydroxymethylglutaryl-CoA lyase